MKLIWRHIRVKLTFALFGFVILFIAAMNINNTDFFTTLIGIYGGIPLITTFNKSGFIFLCLILNYINIDNYLYFLKDNSILLIRYDNKSKLLFTCFRNIMLIQLVFIVSSITLGLLCYFFSGHFLSDIDFLPIILFLFKSWILCLILSQIQMFLLIKRSQSQTFIILAFLSYILTIFSQQRTNYLTILPIITTSKDNCIHIIFCLLVSVVLLFFTKVIFIKKEID